MSILSIIEYKKVILKGTKQFQHSKIVLYFGKSCWQQQHFSWIFSYAGIFPYRAKVQKQIPILIGTIDNQIKNTRRPIKWCYDNCTSGSFLFVTCSYKTYASKTLAIPWHLVLHPLTAGLWTNCVLDKEGKVTSEGQVSQKTLNVPKEQSCWKGVSQQGKCRKG